MYALLNPLLKRNSRKNLTQMKVWQLLRLQETGSWQRLVTGQVTQVRLLLLP